MTSNSFLIGIIPHGLGNFSERIVEFYNRLITRLLTVCHLMFSGIALIVALEMTTEAERSDFRISTRLHAGGRKAAYYAKQTPLSVRAIAITVFYDLV